MSLIASVQHPLVSTPPPVISRAAHNLMRNVGFAFPVYRRLSRQARPGQLTPPPPFKVSTSASVFTQELARLSAALHVLFLCVFLY